MLRDSATETGGVSGRKAPGEGVLEVRIKICAENLFLAGFLTPSLVALPATLALFHFLDPRKFIQIFLWNMEFPLFDSPLKCVNYLIFIRIFISVADEKRF